jgi:urease accessory protein UreE
MRQVPNDSHRAVDYVDIHWDQCRSTLKARSRGGEDIRVLLPRGQSLRHGDVLFEDAARAVIINVLPCAKGSGSLRILRRSDNSGPQ